MGCTAFLLAAGAGPSGRGGAGVPRPIRGFGQAPAAAGAGQGQRGGRGPGRTVDPAAVAEIRAMLEAAAKK